jgi:hypothetical protein
MLVIVSHFHSSLIFSGTKEPYTLDTNIGLEWKYLKMTNTLAYYNTELSTAIHF